MEGPIRCFSSMLEREVVENRVDHRGIEIFKQNVCKCRFTFSPLLVCLNEAIMFSIRYSKLAGLVCRYVTRKRGRGTSFLPWDAVQMVALLSIRNSED